MRIEAAAPGEAILAGGGAGKLGSVDGAGRLEPAPRRPPDVETRMAQVATAAAPATAPATAPAAAAEAALVSAAIAGDARAFATLVAPLLAMLGRVAARASGDRGLAEDAVQETLLIASTNLHRYTPGTSLRAWLARIAATRALTLVRSEARRHGRDAASDPPARAPTPEESAIGRQTAAAIERVLAALPEKRRVAAIMRLDGGLEYAEIAEAIGSSESSARALVYLAVKALRAQLTPPISKSSIHASEGVEP